MSESELQSEDSLQSVKYLGKVHSLYAEGTGIAIVSHSFYSFSASLNPHFSIQGTRTNCMETFEKRFIL